MALNAGSRSDAYFTEGSRWVGKQKRSDLTAESNFLNIMILKALVSQGLEHSGKATVQATLDVPAAEKKFGQAIERYLDHNAKHALPEEGSPDNDDGLYPLLAVLRAAEAIDTQNQRQQWKVDIAKLTKISEKAVRRGLIRGWKLKVLLLKHRAKELQTPELVSYERLFEASVSADELLEAKSSSQPADFAGRDDVSEIIQECVDAVCSNLDADGKLGYLQALLGTMEDVGKKEEASDDTIGDNEELLYQSARLSGQLEAVRRVVELLKGKANDPLVYGI